MTQRVHLCLTKEHYRSICKIIEGDFLTRLEQASQKVPPFNVVARLNVVQSLDSIQSLLPVAPQSLGQRQPLSLNGELRNESLAREMMQFSAVREFCAKMRFLFFHDGTSCTISRVHAPTSQLFLPSDSVSFSQSSGDVTFMLCSVSFILESVAGNGFGCVLVPRRFHRLTTF